MPFKLPLSCGILWVWQLPVLVSLYHILSLREALILTPAMAWCRGRAEFEHSSCLMGCTGLFWHLSKNCLEATQAIWSILWKSILLQLKGIQGWTVQLVQHSCLLHLVKCVANNQLITLETLWILKVRLSVLYVGPVNISLRWPQQASNLAPHKQTDVIWPWH